MLNIEKVNPKTYSALFLLSLLFYTIWFYYLTFINLPKGDFYIPNDEFMIPDSGIFAWYGLPSRCMEWPANPLLLFYYILIGFLSLKNFVLQNIIGHSNISFFEIFDKQVYDYILHKPQYLVYGRVFQFITVIILSILSYKKLKATEIFKENSFGLVLFFLLILGSQTLISTSSLVRPDAIAIMLAVYLISISLSNNIMTMRGQLLMVFTFALLISFRTIYLFFGPFIFYFIYLGRKSLSFNKTMFVLGLLVAFALLFNPYLLTNTLLFLKAFLGNIIGKRHQEMGSYYNIDFIMEQVKQNQLVPIYIIVSIWGIVSFWNKYRKLRVALAILLISNLIYLQSVLTSPTLFTTHIAPLLPFFFLLVSMGISSLIKNRSSLLLGVFAIILVGNFIVNNSSTRKGENMNYFEAANWIRNNGNFNSIAVPEQLDILFADLRSKESFKFEYKLLNDESKKAQKLNKLYSFSDSTKNSFDNMLLRSFMFDEENIKSAAAFISFQQTPENQKVGKMLYLFDDNSLLSETAIVPLQCQSFIEMKPLINNGQIDYLLTKNKRELEKFVEFKKFDIGIGDIYYLYKVAGR